LKHIDFFICFDYWIKCWHKLLQRSLKKKTKWSSPFFARLRVKLPVKSHIMDSYSERSSYNGQCNIIVYVTGRTYRDLSQLRSQTVWKFLFLYTLETDAILVTWYLHCVWLAGSRQPWTCMTLALAGFKDGGFCRISSEFFRLSMTEPTRLLANLLFFLIDRKTKDRRLHGYGRMLKKNSLSIENFTFCHKKYIF